MSKFYISDLHFSHENVIQHDGREFRSVEQMDKLLLKFWNDSVKADDEIYILGDMFWKPAKALEILPQLNGRKFLVRGNHDKVNEKIAFFFEWVKDYAVIEDECTQVVLCHYPIAHWYNQYRGAVHLYGHVHNTKDDIAFKEYARICKDYDIPFECYNVGVMMPYINYTPRTLQYIRNECKNV